MSFVPVDESARNGVDYRLMPGQLTFAVGETQKSIAVEIIDDALFQGYDAYRYFTVRLTGTNLGSTRDFRVFVINDDLVKLVPAPPAISDRGGDDRSGGGGGTTFAVLLALVGALWLRAPARGRR